MNSRAAATVIRYACVVLLAAAVTTGLFVVMFSLIATNDMELDQTPLVPVADVILGATEIDVRAESIKPDKPDEPEQAPPPIDLPRQSTFDIDTSISVNFAPAAAINIGIGNLSVSDGEYLPIVKVAPIYPRRAQTRGIQGYCIIEYTVTVTGAVKDANALECTPKGFFERASMKAAEKFKYKPRVVDGAAQEVTGVRNKFTYTLE